MANRSDLTSAGRSEKPNVCSGGFVSLGQTEIKPNKYLCTQRMHQLCIDCVSVKHNQSTRLSETVSLSLVDPGGWAKSYWINGELHSDFNILRFSLFLTHSQGAYSLNSNFSSRFTYFRTTQRGSLKCIYHSLVFYSMLYITHSDLSQWDRE